MNTFLGSTSLLLKTTFKHPAWINWPNEQLPTIIKLDNAEQARIYYNISNPFLPCEKCCNFVKFPGVEIFGNSGETVPFHKISTPGNYVKLRYFTQFYLRNEVGFTQWSLQYWIHCLMLDSYLELVPPFCDAIMISATTVKLLCISYDLLHTTGHHYSCAFEVGFFSCNYKTSDFAERFTKTSIKFGNHY